MKLTLAAAFAVTMLSTPAFAQSCATLNAQSAGQQVATVRAFMDANPGLFSGRATTNDAQTPTAGAQREITPAEVARDLTSICAADGSKSLAEAAREQTANYTTGGTDR